MDAVSSGSMVTFRVMSTHVDLTAHIDRCGLTCLHKAAQLGHTHLIDELVAAGLDVNTQTSEGYTPLQYAVMEGHRDTVATLLDHGADWSLQNKYQQTGEINSCKVIHGNTFPAYLQENTGK